MTNVYPDSIVIEYYSGTNWIDVSSDVVTDMVGKIGFTSIKPDDRVASLGTLTFSMNNSNGEYSPMGGDEYRSLPTLAGWNKGASLRVTVNYGGESRVVFLGKIESLVSDAGTWGQQRTKVEVVDWFDIAAKTSMKGTNILLNQSIDQVVASILAAMPNPPHDIQYGTGYQEVPSALDNINNKTKVISELNKLALSELGYIYILKTGDMIFESNTDRVGNADLTQIPILGASAGRLLLEDGTYLLLEDGFKLILNDAGYPNLDNSMEDLDLELKGDVINQAYARAYPRRVDTSLVVLYRIKQPITIAQNTSLFLNGQYIDPTGGRTAAGTNMQTPVATTDYVMDSVADGSSGGDLTANLTVTATYTGDRVEYILTSNYAGLAYITKLQARGYGIYKYDTIEVTEEDSASIASFGESPVEIDQKYKADITKGDRYAQTVVEEYKQPKSRIKNVHYLANLNADNMISFLFLDIGSKLKVSDNRSGISNYYYVISMNYTISVGGIIHYSFGLKEEPSIESGGLTQVKYKLNMNNRVNYGVIPEIANLNRLSMSVWIKPTDASTGGRMMQNLNDAGENGFSFALGGDDQMQWYQKHTGAVGIWTSDTGTIQDNTLYHVAVTLDMSANPLAAPLLYIDGVSVNVIEAFTPAGALSDDSALKFKTGSNGFVAEMQDPRVYNRVLSATEIDAIYDAGTTGTYYDVVPDGLIFQGLCLYTDYMDSTTNYNPYTGVSGTFMTENIYRYVGILGN